MNFALALFVLVILTGVAWVADKLVFAPRRRRAADEAVAEFDRQQERIGERFADEDALRTRSELHDQKLRQPWWLEYSASLFPVILVVFLVRSFVIEPFKIPSGSMIPTLIVGDFILVNKYDYGLRLPIINTKVTEGRALERGDVVVFRFPKDTSVDFIKRVIGLPGDVVAYQDKKLTINGKSVPETVLPDYFDEERVGYAKQFEEDLDGRKNAILNNPSVPPFIVGAENFPYRDNCTYNERGVICKVPPGHYFMMGDNRDNSLDSRYWGFVPDKNIVGRAFFIWMNFGQMKRIGSFH
ncbi:signal peptidase I [Paraburkholderia bonniea]|uniref:signal peptidase I n=1 Tax=Paraburkholderia bonniea TaxID=2152891 RepID=UPI0025726C49|nr:signal peptidase I [Paraburkholderia bonniea]WJF89484.1 signal peptidase I [Paraburkholderia bonniea]WJF92799.1 signal peptidase I [Paraburkholderia bonniea]